MEERDKQVKLDCALDLMRRLPPQNIEKNLSDLIDLNPDLCEDLLASVDQPLKIAKCKNTVSTKRIIPSFDRDFSKF